VIGLTKDRQAVILLNRPKKPRKLLSEAKSQAKATGLDLDLTSLRFGRVIACADITEARVSQAKIVTL